MKSTRPPRRLNFSAMKPSATPSVRARIEDSYRRVTELKRRYLKNFTGVAENDIIARLES